MSPTITAALAAVLASARRWAPIGGRPVRTAPPRPPLMVGWPAMTATLTLPPAVGPGRWMRWERGI